jgi:hypothetical protein
MKKAFIAIPLTALALAACESHRGSAPAINQDAIKALGSTLPSSSYDRAYSLKQHDTNTPEWRRAKRFCEQTVLANYPNCMPVNEIVQADLRNGPRPEAKPPRKMTKCSVADTNTTSSAKNGCPTTGCKPLDASTPIRRSVS